MTDPAASTPRNRRLVPPEVRARVNLRDELDEQAMILRAAAALMDGRYAVPKMYRKLAALLNKAEQEIARVR